MDTGRLYPFVGPDRLRHLRRPPQCAAIHLIKEEIFSCDCCAADLPANWNFA